MWQERATKVASADPRCGAPVEGVQRPRALTLPIAPLLSLLFLFFLLLSFSSSGLVPTLLFSSKHPWWSSGF